MAPSQPVRKLDLVLWCPTYSNKNVYIDGYIAIPKGGESELDLTLTENSCKKGKGSLSWWYIVFEHECLFIMLWHLWITSNTSSSGIICLIFFTGILK